MNIIIAAGGTAGHINAALALGERYSSQKSNVYYISGKRHLDYKLFPENTYHISAMPLRKSNPFSLLVSILKNVYALFQVLGIFIQLKPKIVIGCGGYVCGPVVFLAFLFRVPRFILEQNAVAGVTNRMLSNISNLIFVHFKNTKFLKTTGKVVVVGNPTRSQIQYPTNELSSGMLKVLIFGGSLGAQQINQLVDSLITKYTGDIKLEIIHQVGKDKTFNIQNNNQLIKYTQHEYLDNIQEQYEWCNLIICRSGASTISELRIIQKPSLLIPLPTSTDNHQWHNAQEFQLEKVCPVEVIDSTQEQGEILGHLIEAINNLSTFKKRERVNVNSSVDQIINEIEKYASNK
jgi:UDP-N-acetylglucosamine--N-acetylmuramyl-(pentapeptide) pyrophosphoryl-undecaprenol N-acetylglucosamine transferase